MLESNFVIEVIRVLSGNIITQESAIILAERLGSIEELLAWIIFRSEFSFKEPNIIKSLNDIAYSKVVYAEIQREQSGFPIYYHQATSQLDASIFELLTCDYNQSKKNTSASNNLIEYIDKTNCSSELRYNLGIKSTKQ